MRVGEILPSFLFLPLLCKAFALLRNQRLTLCGALRIATGNAVALAMTRRDGLPRQCSHWLAMTEITDCHIVEAQDTTLHFLQAGNFTCILASPLPTKAVRLCGGPIERLAMTEENVRVAL